MSSDANLNALLRWSIENDPEAIQRNAALVQQPSSTTAGQGQPESYPSSRGLALHPSDTGAPAAAPAPANMPRSKEEMDAILAALAGGRGGKRKSEADMMVEQMAVAMGKVTVDGGKEVDHDDRVIALDNFEMLIESIDNANLLLPLKLWTPLFSLLHPPAASAGPEDKTPAFVNDQTPAQLEEIQAAAAWIIGTAVQNNPKCQTELLTWGTASKASVGEPGGGGGERPVTTLLRLLLSSPSTQVRNKCAYAISALLKHYPAAVRHFSVSEGNEETDADTVSLDQTSCLAGWGAGPGDVATVATDSTSSSSAARDTSGAQAWFAQHGRHNQGPDGPVLNGWTVLSHALLDPSLLVRRKVAFLVNSLLLQWTEAAESASTTRTSDGTGSRGVVGDARPAPSGAPAELPPETMRQGSLTYDGVLSGLVSAGVIQTLLLSLLPEDDADGDDDGAGERSVLAGANGDEEPRRDEDYAEKAVRAVVCFARCADTLLGQDAAGEGEEETTTARGRERETVRAALRRDGRLRRLYGRLVRELAGPALGDGGGKRDAELGLEAGEVAWLSGWTARVGE